MNRGDKVAIRVLAIEFVEGGNTIWVQGIGGTVLRIKTDGRITSEVCQNSPVSHTDINTRGDIRFCLSHDHDKDEAPSFQEVGRRLGLKDDGIADGLDEIE